MTLQTLWTTGKKVIFFGAVAGAVMTLATCGYKGVCILAEHEATTRSIQTHIASDPSEAIKQQLQQNTDAIHELRTIAGKQDQKLDKLQYSVGELNGKMDAMMKNKVVIANKE